MNRFYSSLFYSYIRNNIYFSVVIVKSTFHRDMTLKKLLHAVRIHVAAGERSAFNMTFQITE